MTPPLTSPQARPVEVSPVSMSTEAACARLGCGKTKLKELLREGRLVRAKRLGAKTRVTIESVEALELELVPRHRPAAPPRRRVPRHRPVPGSGGAAVLAIPID